MHLRIIAIGKGMPKWVAEGFAEYAHRLPKPWSLQLIELKATNNRNTSIDKVVSEEGERILNTLQKDHKVIALDEKGQLKSTLQLADNWSVWHEQNQPVDLIIGGANGLSKECLQRADQILSLSKMTMPHMLVRVVLAEQIYRVWSVMNRHPYHREGKAD